MAAMTPDTYPVLRQGAAGKAVGILQEQLFRRGLMSAKIDGVFGTITDRAVRAFQALVKLEPDGIVGPKTWAALLGFGSNPAPVPVASASEPVRISTANTATTSTGMTFVDWLVRVAMRDLGKTEKPRNNQGEWIKKFWPSTTYPDGYAARQPYCAAAMAYWLDTAGDELDKAGQLERLTGMTGVQFEKWRCKSARAWDWQPWGKKAKGVTVLPDSAQPQKGDVVVFDFSHIGLVVGVPSAGRIATIEANTGPAGERDGDGCWQKNRPQEVARCFLRFNFA